MSTKSSFAETLLRWYQTHGRDLPWRHTKDPYLIWISEIILQQTRVAQGYEYYCRFVKRFPDVQSLAEAEEDEVMKLWQGLGYYSRARNLHTAARQIQEKGYFPTTYEEVRKLKGVGDYTAAAICSFAYGHSCAVVDGNVYRVLSRYFGIDEPIDTTQGKKLFSALAAQMIPAEDTAIYNQAIMDFGATQCVPSSPRCLFCPLSEECTAFREKKVENLPCKTHKTKVTERFFTCLYIRSGNHTFIRKRGAGDIWQNLYEIPLIETAQPINEAELPSHPEFLSLIKNERVNRIQLIARQTKHVLSHRIIYSDCYAIDLESKNTIIPGYRRIKEEELFNFPVPRLLSRFFSLILRAER